MVYTATNKGGASDCVRDLDEKEQERKLEYRVEEISEDCIGQREIHLVKFGALNGKLN